MQYRECFAHICPSRVKERMGFKMRPTLTYSFTGAGEFYCIPLSEVEESVGHKGLNDYTSSSNLEGELNCIPPFRVEKRVRFKALPHHTPTSNLKRELNFIPPYIVEGVVCEGATHWPSSCTEGGKINFIPPSAA